VPAGVPAPIASLLATYTMGKVDPETLAGSELDAGVAEKLTLVAGVAPKGVLAERYKKEALRLKAEVQRGEGKLANERFVANAKPGVVAKEREKLENYRAELARVEAALKEMGVPE
jgi:valyl-tRNA synthetase